MTKENKTAEFKIITDKKDEPDLKAGSSFCWWLWLRELLFLMVTYLLLNEEGKLMGLPLNLEATASYGEDI